MHDLELLLQKNFVLYMRKLFFFFFVFIWINTYSQDPVFTQFYNVPEALNPAFAGGGGGSEIGILNRTQWPGLDYSLNSQFFFFDNYIDKYNSGIELTILNQLETVTRYNFTQINLNYSYHVKLSKDWNFHPAISVGLGNKDYAFNSLLLEDQIIIDKGIINFDSSDPFLTNSNAKFLDIGAGFLIFNDYLWFGGSYKHLNEPNASFQDDGENIIEGFLSIHGGYRIPFTKFYSNTEYNLFINFNYMKQSDYDRIDIGSKMQINDFTFGAFATLAPTSVQSKSHKLTSINFITNLDYRRFSFGYSYDLNVSSLQKTKGVFEISVSYKFDSIFGKDKFIPCGCK